MLFHNSDLYLFIISGVHDDVGNRGVQYDLFLWCMG